MTKNKPLFRSSMPTFWGLVLNAFGNGLFLALVTKWTSGETLLQIMILWSAIFWASTLVSPSENLMVYDKIEGNPVSTLKQLLALSCLAFGITGFLLVLLAQFDSIVIPFLLLLGVITGYTTKLKALCIVKGYVKTIARANVADGCGKCFTLLIVYFCNRELTLTWTMFSFLAGSIICSLVYVSKGLIHDREIHSEKKLFSRIIGVGIVGALSALTMGSLPFFTSVFNPSTQLAPFVSFFLVARSFLLFHGILSINNPQLLKKIGDLKSPVLGVALVVVLIPFLYFALVLTRNALIVLGYLNLSPIRDFHVLLFATALVFGLIFSIYLTSQNASDTWFLSFIACAAGHISIIGAFLLVSSDVYAFLISAITAPFVGILVLSFMRTRK